MKKLLLLTTLMSSLIGYTEEGKGGHGGFTDEYGNLMDTNPNVVCTSWKSGQRMISENPGINRILDRVSQVNWVVAHSMRRELENLAFCSTGELVHLGEQYESPFNCQGFSPTMPEFDDYRQAGIRLGDQVFIDRSIFRTLSQRQKALLVLHETAHSFFTPCTMNRRMRMQSFVNSLIRVADGVLTNSDNFIYEIEQNYVEIPYQLPTSDIPSEVFTFINSSIDEQVRRLQSTDIGDLLIVEENDTDILVNNLIKESVKRVTTQVCSENDNEQVNNLLENEELGLVISSACLNSSTNPEIINNLLESDALNHGLNEFYSRLSTNRFKMNDNGTRLVSSTGLALFDIPSEIQILDIFPENRDIASHIEMKAFIEVISFLIERNEVDLSNRLIRSNSNFYAAFGVSGVQAQMNEIHTNELFNRHVARAANRVSDIYSEFFTVTRTVLIEVLENSEEQVNRFFEGIDEDRLGYELN